MDDLGQKFGKYDLERVGLFWEMPYMIDDPYVNRKISMCNCNNYYIIQTYIN